MTRFLTWLVAAPVGIVLIALGVANRRAVTISLDPFAPDAPALALSAPLFVLLLGAVILGVVLGGLAVWVSQRSHRREERHWRDIAQRLEAEKARAADTQATPARLTAPVRAA